MKLVALNFIITTLCFRFFEASSSNNLETDKISACSSNLWPQGKVPYEISQQFDEKDLDLIKEALIDIMKTTCIKFVPHTNEPDYIVFVEYKHPNQTKRACWSGKGWNNGTVSIGNKKGRHIVSLWRDLECYNKLDIIREISNVLGFQSKSSTLIFKEKTTKMRGVCRSYEENLRTEHQMKPHFFMEDCTNESAFLSKYPYAFDKKEWLSIAKKDTCSVMRNLIQINRIYKCSANKEKNRTNDITNLSHTRPNCKAEAETGACKSDPDFMRLISCHNFCAGYNPTPRKANLINGLGKCVNSGNCPGYNNIKAGINLHQWDCDPSVRTMLYSWYQSSLGSSDRHICDGSGYCITTPGNVKWSLHLIAYPHGNLTSQRFTFVDSLTHPGFYAIKNVHGKCLSVKGNTNETGAPIWADDCNPLKAGQRWKWHN